MERENKKFCLIGNPLGHSFSAQIHGKFGYGYDLVQLEESGLEQFVKKNDYDGFNVTIPFKQKIMPLLDEISQSARKIGAVNTVVKREGKLAGFNTDFSGMKFALELNGINLKGKKVLILGGGGTSSTAKAVAEALEAKETVTVTRSGQNNYGNLNAHFDSEVVINTTPVGMYPENSGELISLDGFTKLEGVFDVVYNPLRTNLILAAQKKGIMCGGGLSMLVAQAFFAREIFTGAKATFAEIKEFSQEFQKQKENIVLVGMPGSGKSTLATALAKQTGREFADTDAAVTDNEKMSISEIFKQKGEEYFRQCEKKAVEDCAKKFSVVISTGGGVVLNKTNVSALKQNGVIFYIERELNYENCPDRPLVKSNDDLIRLSGIRKPFYESAADFTVQNNGGAESCVKKILEKFYNGKVPE